MQIRLTEYVHDIRVLAAFGQPKRLRKVARRLPKSLVMIGLQHGQKDCSKISGQIKLSAQQLTQVYLRLWWWVVQSS